MMAKSEVVLAESPEILFRGVEEVPPSNPLAAACEKRSAYSRWGPNRANEDQDRNGEMSAYPFGTLIFKTLIRRPSLDRNSARGTLSPLFVAGGRFPTPMRKRLTISSCEVPQFPRQICDRSEHASDNDIALDLGKPQLVLIRVGRREVKPDFQILL